jgi:hypothetical protein
MQPKLQSGGQWGQDSGREDELKKVPALSTNTASYESLEEFIPDFEK